MILNRKMKNRLINPIICLALIISILFSGCKKDDDNPPPDCGCYSETNFTIPESNDLVAEMHFKSQDGTYYNNLYWIVYTEEDCSNCASSMIVCNEDFLNNAFEDIKDSGETVEVKFSGNLKSICDKRNNPAGYTLNRIILTSIERQ